MLSLPIFPHCSFLARPCHLTHGKSRKREGGVRERGKKSGRDGRRRAEVGKGGRGGRGGRANDKLSRKWVQHISNVLLHVSLFSYSLSHTDSYFFLTHIHSCFFVSIFFLLKTGGCRVRRLGSWHRLPLQAADSGRIAARRALSKVLSIGGLLFVSSVHGGFVL